MIAQTDLVFMLCLKVRKLQKPPKYILKSILNLNKLTWYNAKGFNNILPLSDKCFGCEVYITHKHINILDVCSKAIIKNKTVNVYCEKCSETYWAYKIEDIGDIYVNALSYGCYNCDSICCLLIYESQLLCFNCFIKNTSRSEKKSGIVLRKHLYFYKNIHLQKQCERAGCYNYPKVYHVCLVCAFFACSDCFDYTLCCGHRKSLFNRIKN